MVCTRPQVSFEHAQFNPITIMLSQVNIINVISGPITRRYMREAI